RRSDERRQLLFPEQPGLALRIGQCPCGRPTGDPLAERYGREVEVARCESESHCHRRVWPPQAGSPAALERNLVVPWGISLTGHRMLKFGLIFAICIPLAAQDPAQTKPEQEASRSVIQPKPGDEV